MPRTPLSIGPKDVFRKKKKKQVVVPKELQTSTTDFNKAYADAAANKQSVRLEKGEEEKETSSGSGRKPKILATPETFTDSKTGEASGIRLADGTTYLGLSPDEVAQVAARQTEIAARPEGTAPVGTTAQEQSIQRQQQELQATGMPVRRELDPTLQTGENFPVLGPLMNKIRKTLGLRPESRSLIDLISGEGKTGEEFFELQPEELKTLALTQIERNEIEKGLTDSEEFGSWIESLGLGGLSNFAAEKPSENAQTMLRRIKTAKTEATNVEMKVKDGTYTRSYGESEIDRIEKKLQSFESRLKVLIQNSPELKFDSDGVNYIEDKVLEARVRLFSARINIVSSESNDPSDMNTLIALQESISQEDTELFPDRFIK